MKTEEITFILEATARHVKRFEEWSIAQQPIFGYHMIHMTIACEPAYLKLYRDGELEQRAIQAYSHLAKCDGCAWNCGVDRLANVKGICQTGEKVYMSNFGPHMGEEDPLRGWRGSGTIFFSRCNLRCQYCQNHDISQANSGELVEPDHIAAAMLDLQNLGCHNINFVSPSHVVPQILTALVIAARSGLKLPLVYNTGGYDSITMLKLLDGVIDIYMPDMKYSSPQIARHYSKIPRYPQVNQEAVKEMHRQVGDLQIDERGIATRGLLIRHLVLPNGLSGTDQIMRFIAEEISPNTYVNLMDQYRPAFNANQFPKLKRPITSKEYQEAVELAHSAGVHRLDERKSLFFIRW